MFVMTVVALFAYYSHLFYLNPQFSTSATVSYIDITDADEKLSLQTNRTTLAVDVWGPVYNSEQLLRVRFY